MNKLFIFTDWFLPAHKAGGPIKSLDNIINLLHREFDIYVFTSNREFDANQSTLEVPINQWVQLDNCKIFYASGAHFYSQLVKEFKNINPEIAYLNSIFSFRYSILPLIINRFTSKFKNTKFIVAPRGMLQEGALSIKSNKKKAALLLFRLIGLYKNIRFHATDEVEVIDIKKKLNINGQLIKIVSNIPSLIANELRIIKPKNSLRLVFIARLSKKKNLQLVLDSLLQIESDYIITLDIYGPNELEYLQSLQQLIESVNSKFKVNYFGDLEFDEVAQKLSENHVYILPSLGENFGHSIFEALSAGLPVIISDRTPWRHLKELKVGFDISLNNTYEFKNAIVHFAQMNSEEFLEWSANAKIYANDYYKNQDFLLDYKNLFQLHRKIGIVGPIPIIRYKGGISIFIEQLLKRKAVFHKKGVYLFHLNTCVIPRKNKSIGKMHVVNLHNYLLFLFRSFKTIKKEKIKQLHIHTSIGLSLIKECFTAWLFRLFWGQKIILHIHFAEKNQLLPKSLQWLTKRLLKASAHEYIVLSNNIKKYLISLGIPAEKIHQINNFHFQNDIPVESKENDVKIITCIGSLDQRKGIVDLMTAMGKVESKLWQLHIVGEFIDDNYKQHVIDIGMQYGITDKVVFHGYLDENKKNDILKVTDVLVLPSYAEGMPLTILEGLAFGTAIVATDVGANSEFLKGVCNLVPSGDTDRIAHEISELLENKELLDTRKSQSLELSTKFTFEDYFEKILPIYQSNKK